MRGGEPDRAARSPQAHNMHCWRAVRPHQAHSMCQWSPRREGEASAREKSSRIFPHHPELKQPQAQTVTDGVKRMKESWRPGEGGVDLGWAVFPRKASVEEELRVGRGLCDLRC